MWIVRLALARAPYTFSVVLALVTLILLTPVVLVRTPDGHFPGHQYPGDQPGLDLHGT